MKALLFSPQGRRRLRLYYLCALTVYLAVREVVPLRALVSHAAVAACVLCAGFLLIALDLCFEQSCLRQPAAARFLLFLAVCALSSLVNRQYGLAANLRVLGALALLFFLCFPFGAESCARELRVLFGTLQVTWFVPAGVSVAMYLFGVEYALPGGSWGTVPQGFNLQYCRLWGVFQDPNYAGFVCLLCLYGAFYRRDPPLWRGAQIAVQGGYLVLGGSRAAQLLLILTAALWALYRKRRVLHAACAAAAAVVMIVAAQYALPCARRLALRVPHAGIAAFYDRLYAGSGAEPVRGSEEEEPPGARLARTDEKNDLSNGRFTRWRQTLRLFCKAPLLGASPRGLSAFAQERAPDTLMARYGIAPHNGYLDVLVGSGILGFLCLLQILIPHCLALLRALIRRPFTAARALTAACLFTLLGSAVFLSDLFFLFTEGALFFWTLLGRASV